MVTGREKIGKEAIRKMGKQGEIVTKSKIVEVRNTQKTKKKEQRKMTKERNRKYIQYITGEHRTIK